MRKNSLLHSVVFKYLIQPSWILAAVLPCQCAHALQHRTWTNNTYQYMDWQFNTLMHSHTSALYLYTGSKNFVVYTTPISGQSQVYWPLQKFTSQKWILTVLIGDTCIIFIQMMFEWLLWFHLTISIFLTVNDTMMPTALLQYHLYLGSFYIPIYFISY